MNDTAFRTLVLGHWKKHGRHDLPWRKTANPYAVLVSEIMLQQTQVSRVVPKFRAFRRAFPSFRRLAAARTGDVVRLWQGLGYNRRALMLHRCARAVVHDHNGKLPMDHESLRKLPGIGPYTAGAVMAFAYDKPWPVIETNIRRVVIHHYFPKRQAIPDSEILKVVVRTLDHTQPRRWYSAMMDYGTWLAGQIPNPNRRSGQYVRQSKFEGSSRQLRGRILRLLLEHGRMTVPRLARMTQDARTSSVVAALVDEGMVQRRGMVIECQ